MSFSHLRNILLFLSYDLFQYEMTEEGGNKLAGGGKFFQVKGSEKCLLKGCKQETCFLCHFQVSSDLHL